MSLRAYEHGLRVDLGSRWGPDRALRVSKIQVIGQQAIIANIYKFKDDLRNDILDMNRRLAARVKYLAQMKVPFDTGRSRDSIREDFSEQGFVFTVGYDKSVFDADGVPYYPPFFELGTSRQAAQPTLRPAFEQASDEYRNELRAVIRRVTR